HGRSPVRHLASLGLLDARLVAAHCVWVDSEEIALLAASRVGVVHNPRSNLKLASGIAPVPDMLSAGVSVGLGTDGAASNNELELLAEIQFAALLHKGVRLDPLAVPAIAALEMATIGGARALGLDARIGSLEVGKRADVVVIDFDEDSLVPLYDPVSHLAYAIEAADVRTVIVDGRIVVAEGALVTAPIPVRLPGFRGPRGYIHPGFYPTKCVLTARGCAAGCHGTHARVVRATEPLEVNDGWTTAGVPGGCRAARPRIAADVVRGGGR